VFVEAPETLSAQNHPSARIRAHLPWSALERPTEELFNQL